MNDQERIKELEAENAQLRQDREQMGCSLAGPGRGDCDHFVGLPGKSIPGQHDGPDDTVDCYGKPNGWCWSCWKDYKLQKAEELVASYDRQNELIGTEFEGVDEVTYLIRILKDKRDQSRATIAALDPVLRETIDSINSLRNAYANSPINPAWVRLIDARNKLSAFLTSTALKTEVGS